MHGLCRDWCGGGLTIEQLERLRTRTFSVRYSALGTYYYYKPLPKKFHTSVQRDAVACHALCIKKITSYLLIGFNNK